MAEAFFNHLSKTKKAISAGIKPDKKIHPLTVKLMKEVRVDVKRKKPKLITDRIMKKVDKIILMAPDLSKKIPLEYLPKLEKWHIEKLLGKSPERARKIRDRIKKKVEQLIQKVN